MFERFTDRARRVLVLAQEEARLLHHDFIGTEHILLGLIGEEGGVASKALVALGVDLAGVRQTIEETIGPVTGAAPTGSAPFTPRSKKVLELSLREAVRLGHNYIGTEHILLGLIREGEGVAAQVLVGEVGDLDRVRTAVIELLQGRTSSPVTPPAGSDTPSALTPAAGRIFERALQSGAGRTSSFDFLLAIASDPSSQGGRILAAAGLTTEALETLARGITDEGTSDETPEQALARQIHVQYDNDAVIVRIDDPAVRQRMQDLLQSEKGGLSGSPALAEIVAIVLNVAQSLSAGAFNDEYAEPDPPVTTGEAVNLLHGIGQARIEAAAAKSPKPEITAHEADVLEGLAAGVSIDDVASTMGVSVEQAESMARNVRAKLMAHRTETTPTERPGE